MNKDIKQYSFKVGNHQGSVIIVFPQPVRDISFLPPQARAVAELMLHHAQLAEGAIILPPGMTREEPKPPEPPEDEPDKP